ncbi:MAG: hypothetical protein KAR42_05380 [candidate division Zixibacteria bacterium]|nr:hypothetical protein [candidate division Zixibacteria bacterium]
MNLTNISIVRNHLYKLNPGPDSMRDFSLRLSSDISVQLPHARISDSSEKVKAVEQHVPNSEEVTLYDLSVSLNHSYLAAGTVACADSVSLGRVYQENTDYTVDYTKGEITRISEGAIQSGQKVTVWSVFYQIYHRNLDYAIDYERGRLRRLASGSIEENQELLVDYQLGTSEFSDAEIEQCIVEAEAEISLLIDDKYTDSIDPALQTAATCLALSYISRNTAASMSASSGNNSLTYWLDLAASYRETAMRLLSWYRRDTPVLHSPERI